MKLGRRHEEVSLAPICPNYANLVNDLLAELQEFSYKGEFVGMRFLEKRRVFFSPPPSTDVLCTKLGRFYKRIVASLLSVQNKSLLLDDTPWNILFLPQILRLDDSVRCIHIYRDPRDVVASFSAQVWMPNDLLRCARIYRAIMAQWFEIRKQIPAGVVFEVSLEHLAASPESVLGAVCDFLRIPWDPALLGIEFNRTHAGRWKTDFTVDQRESICKVLDPIIEALKYPR